VRYGTRRSHDDLPEADRFKLRVWQTGLDHYRLFGIDDLEQARTYATPQFSEQFGSFTTLTRRYGGPAVLKANLEAIKQHLYVPMST
jgi:type I restriction enzyme R subunit